MRLPALYLISALLPLLVSCGQKGALFLPPDETPVDATTIDGSTDSAALNGETDSSRVIPADSKRETTTTSSTATKPDPDAATDNPAGSAATVN